MIGNIVLSPGQSLEQYRRKLSSMIDRPVYIRSAITEHLTAGRDFYRESNVAPYRKFGTVEMFLSTFTHKETDGYMNSYGKVVNGREAVGLKSRACTLTLSQNLCLTYPVIPEDQIDETVGPGTMGMYGENKKTKFPLIDLCIGNLNKVPVKKSDFLPSELVKYVRTVRHDYGSNTFDGICFVSSCVFDAPTYIKNDWELGPEVKISHSKDPAWLIHAPGQYANFPHMHLDRHVKQGITIRDPGECVACRGSSGDKVHIGFTSWSDGPWLDGLLCRACFKHASATWSKMMDQIG